MAFEVRAAAFAQLNIALAKLDDEQAVQLEVQQRLWPRCGRTTPAAPTGGAGPMLLITTVFDTVYRRKICNIKSRHLRKVKSF
jgi:hypothetical protein